jgi:hypothetical protein
MPRAKVTIGPSAPASALRGHAAVREVFRALDRASKDAVPRYRKVRENRDLTEEAQERDSGTISEAFSTEVRARFAQARAEVAIAVEALDAELASALHADPMPLLDPRAEGLTPDVRASRELANRIGMQTKMQARMELDRKLDAAFAADAKGDHLAVARVIEWAASDAVLDWTAATHGVDRIRSEGSEVAQTVTLAAIDARRERAIESRPEVAEIAGHADHLREMPTLLGMLEAEVATRKYLETGKGVALDAIRGSLDPAYFE